jgi:hypothetical protein
LPFHTNGCVPPQITPSCKENFSNQNKFKISNIDGGAAYPYLDKSSSCKFGDKNCIQSCVGNAIAQNGLENDCLQYVNYNKYCVCDPKNYYSKCGRFLDKTMRECTNNNGTLASLCEGQPDRKVDQCIDNIPLSDKYPRPITNQTDCKPKDPNEPKDPLCEYVVKGKVQQCVADKLYHSDNPNCAKYKNPNNLYYVCDEDINEPGSCKKDMQKYISDCFPNYNPKKLRKGLIDVWCMETKYNYHPQYDYDLSPISCNSPGPSSYPDDDEEDFKENFKCVNHYLEDECDPTKLDYQNIKSYYTNTVNNHLLTMSGWVGLPEVFLKYQYNNYFIRANNVPTITTFMNIYPMIKGFKNYIQSKNSDDPNNLFNIYNNNPDISIQENFDDDDAQCLQYVDKKTYFKMGAQFPKKFPMKKTVTVDGPGCNYYMTLCQCQNRGKKVAPKCNDQGLGFLDCKGESCFDKWKFDNDCIQFIGKAVPFALSANTSDVIIFPDPDNSYIGCPTVLDPSSIYIIWMDIPTTPITPGFENIKNNHNQLRYWSLGHYAWEVNILNQRPVLSSLMDQDAKSKHIEYIDFYTKDAVKGNRICVILATFTQYTYLTKKGLWDDRLQWLNWGKTVKPSLPEDVLKNSSADFPDSIQDIVDAFKTPSRGILLLRQLLPNSNYEESISKYVSSNPECLARNIPVKQGGVIPDPYKYGMDPQIQDPILLSKFCNPGNQDICDLYKLNPCCLCEDLLPHMKQYYPRCEKVSICDLEIMGKKFWDKYFGSLPYIYK